MSRPDERDCFAWFSYSQRNPRGNSKRRRWGAVSGRVCRGSKHEDGYIVSAGAKIPIVPFEFSPPLDVVNRDALQMEEVPKLVKGERRARTQRTATARNEHP